MFTLRIVPLGCSAGQLSFVGSLLMARYCPINAVFLLAILSGCTDNQTDIVPRAHASESNVTENAHNWPSAEDISRNYGRLRLITKEPVLVDPQFAMLCVGIWKQHVDDARKRSGPHAHTSIRIFMNDLATSAFRKSKAYPVGSVIVKEKQGLEYKVNDTTPEGSAKTRDGVGGMIKRPVGYDPEHGDWEYFYFEDVAEIEYGKINSCIECHRGAAQSDYVFGNWASGG